MEVFKTLAFFSDNSEHLVDTISYEGNWWLVASWFEQPATKERIPKRLILLGGPEAGYQEVQGHPYRFRMSNSIPKVVLDGEKQGAYVIAYYPALAHTQGPQQSH